MARASTIRSVSAFLLGAVAALAALQVPAGTRIEIRLKSKISSQTAKVKDGVEAVVISPVVAGGEFLVPAGALARGAVEKVTASTKPDERSTLTVAFTELEFEGAKHRIAARIAAIDNARESVDEHGEIAGILANETLSGRLDAGLGKLAERSSGFADILSTVKKAVLHTPESDIAYDAGTDLEIELTAPLELKAAAGPGPAAKLVPLPMKTRCTTSSTGRRFKPGRRDR